MQRAPPLSSAGLLEISAEVSTEKSPLKKGLNAGAERIDKTPPRRDTVDVIMGAKSNFSMKEDVLMSLEGQFLNAQQRVNNLSRRPSDHQLLELYGFYKQATLGDVTGNRPGGFDFKGRAKWEAWSLRRGLSKEEAMVRYVETVERLERELG